MNVAGSVTERDWLAWQLARKPLLMDWVYCVLLNGLRWIGIVLAVHLLICM